MMAATIGISQTSCRENRLPGSGTASGISFSPGSCGISLMFHPLFLEEPVAIRLLTLESLQLVSKPFRKTLFTQRRDDATQSFYIKKLFLIMFCFGFRR